MRGLVVFAAAVLWASACVAVVVGFERCRRRPITPTDEALTRADRELDEIEAACRHRHPSHWRGVQW